MNIPDSLLDAFKKDNVAVFIGSGLSGSKDGHTGYPTTRVFTKILAEEVVISEGIGRRICDLIDCRYHKNDECQWQRITGATGCDYPLAEIAEYYEIYAGPNRLVGMIRKHFGHKKATPQEIHKKLWQLPKVTEVFTTNFDTLIERGLSKTKARATPDVVVGTRTIPALIPPSFVVHKLHGCAENSKDRSEFVITKNDYLNFTYEHPLQKLRTQSVLTERVFLFLGYSLTDLNFELLFLETIRMLPQREVSCYAVLKDVSKPIIDYWKNRRLIIIRGNAEKAVDAILKSRQLHLYTREDEWKKKLGARDDEKEIIVARACSLLKDIVSKERTVRDKICIILDSGTTTLRLANHLVEELEKEENEFQDMQIITNCTEIVHTLDWLRDINLFVIGGKLRVETKSLIPKMANGQSRKTNNTDHIFKQLFPWQKEYFTIALMGASGIDKKGFKTNTNEEVKVKEQMIKAADKVIFLADHSKFRAPGKYTFSKHNKKYVIITDRRVQDQSLDKMYGDKIIIA